MNEATCGGLVFTIKKDGKEIGQKTFYDKPLCDPCVKELGRCSECKTKEAKCIITKNNQDIILCGECDKKIQERKHPKCKECKKELELPFFGQGAVGYGKYCCLDCWVKIEEGLRGGATGWYETDKEMPSKDIRWLKEKNAWACFIGDKVVWEPSKKTGNYVRKYSSMTGDNNAKKDEPVEKETMTCDKCKVEFSQGYAVYTPNVFFCEKCGQENGAHKEFKVWIEAVKKEKQPQEPENNSKVPEQKPKKEPGREQPEPQESPEPKPSPSAKKPEKTLEKCEECGDIENFKIHPIVYKGRKICVNCHHKLLRAEYGAERKKEKPKETSSHNKHLCEGCGVSCWDQKTKQYILKRIWHSDFNFNEEVRYFSENCSCAEEFKKTKQQTCAQCQKREWPDMRKGWALDYGLKKIFCSPMCHMLYHKSLWEQKQQKQSTSLKNIPDTVKQQWFKNTELFPMELELSSEDEKDFDWEKAANKKELLTLKAIVKVLEESPQALEDKNFVQPDDAPKFTFKAELEQWERAEEYARTIAKEWGSTRSSYTAPKTSIDWEYEKAMEDFRDFKLCRSIMSSNSFQKAQQTYAEKYGQTELNNLLNPNQVQQPKRNYWPLIVGGGLIMGGIIGLVVYFLWKGKKK